MSIAKLSASSAEKYYYEKDAVFNENGENQNLVWGGEIAKELGLDGIVNKEDFKSVLEGKIGDTDLRDTSKKTSGEDRKAFDLALSAPKSVSHAGLVLDKKDIVEAHKEAVAETMKFVESLAQSREYNSSNERVKTDTNKLLYASALHSTSRATAGNVADPSLHSHNVIMNSTINKDGKFVSLNTDKLFQNQDLINKVYKDNLANNLREKGYSLDFDKKGNFELTGYDKTVIEHFSKRKNEIDKQVEVMKLDPKFLGKSNKELRDYAQHNFKQEKQDISKEELTKNWDKQHKEEGITSKEDLLKRIDEGKSLSKDRTKLSVNEVLKIAGENLTDKESHFTKETLLKEAIKINKGDNKISDIEKVINEVKKTGQKEDWELKKITVDKEERFTTKEIYDIEKENLKLIAEALSSEALLTKEQAEKGIASFEEKMGWKMSETQRESAMMALTTEDKFVAIQGDAGTGKTTMLDAVRHSIEFNNKDSSELLVLAPTGKAASGAKAESGIEGMTVDSYLIQQDMNKKATKEEIKEAKKELKEMKDSSKKDNDLDSKQESKDNKNSKDNKQEESSNKSQKEEQKTENQNKEDKREENRFKTKDVNLDKDKIKNHSKSMKENLQKENWKIKGMALAFSKEYTKIKMGGGKLEITKLDDGSHRTKTTSYNKNTGFVETNSKTKFGTRKVEMGEQHGEHKLKITDTYNDKSKRVIEISKTNLLGKKTSEIDEKASEKAGKDIYKDTTSKKISDKIFKNDEAKFKQINSDKSFSETSKKETKILSAISNYEEKEKNFTGKHHLSFTEKSFKGLGIEYSSKTSEKKGNIALLGNAEGRTLELKKETSLKIFGKEIDTSFLNQDYSKKEITLDNFKETLKNFVNKVDNAIKGEKDRDSYLIKETLTDSKNKLVEKTVIKSEQIDKDLREVKITKEDKEDLKFSKQIQEKDKSVEIDNKNISKKDLDKNNKETLNNFEEKKEGRKVIFIDESSMLSAKKLNSILKDAKESGNRIVFIGDTKQLAAVQQGKGFEETQKTVKTTSHMNEGMRQKTAETKDVVDSFAKEKPREGLEKLDKQDNLKEMSKEEQIKYASEKLSKDGAYKNTAVLAGTKEDVKAVNEATRKALFGKADAGVKTQVREDKRLDLVAKMNANNYEKGDRVSLKFKTLSEKDRFGDYEVAGINKEKNEILLKSDKKSFTVNLQKEAGNITSVDKIVDKNFIEGDKVINLKNDKTGLMNGDVGYVKSIDEKKGIMSVEFGEGKNKRSVDFDLKDQNKTLDHAYAMTFHKSQGITVDNVIALFDTKSSSMNNANTSYVAVSRAKQDIKVLTDNKELLKEQVGKSQEKTSTNDSKESKEERKEELGKFEDLKEVKQEEIKEDKKDLDNKQELKEEKTSTNDSKEDKSNNKDLDNKQESKDNKISIDDIKTDNNKQESKEEKTSTNDSKEDKSNNKDLDNKQDKKEEFYIKS